MERARVFPFGLATLLAACAPVSEERSRPPAACSGEPSFYRSLARPDAAVDQEAVREMISQHRRNNGIAALTLDDELCAAARRLADDMASRDAVVPQSALKLERRLDAAGAHAKVAVANVSACYRTLAEAFSGGGSRRRTMRGCFWQGRGAWGSPRRSRRAGSTRSTGLWCWRTRLVFRSIEFADHNASLEACGPLQRRWTAGPSPQARPLQFG